MSCDDYLSRPKETWLLTLLSFFSTKTGLTEDAEADLIIGADGAHSTVRRIMAKRRYFDYSQTYIKHKYVELTVPAGENKEVRVDHDRTDRVAFDIANLRSAFDSSG